MMYNYPFFSFPTFRSYSYYPNNKFIPKASKNEVTPISSNKLSNSRPLGFSSMSHSNISKANNHKTIDNSKNEVKKSKEIHKKTIKNESNALFEVFGIKLYFDDILLISLIFFLYSEGVKDDYLFISLILLLLS